MVHGGRIKTHVILNKGFRWIAKPFTMWTDEQNAQRGCADSILGDFQDPIGYITERLGLTLLLTLLWAGGVDKRPPEVPSTWTMITDCTAGRDRRDNKASPVQIVEYSGWYNLGLVFRWSTKFLNTVSLSTTENPSPSPQPRQVVRYRTITECLSLWGRYTDVEVPLFPVLLCWVVRGDCVSFQLREAIVQYPFPPDVLFWGCSDNKLENATCLFLL